MNLPAIAAGANGSGSKIHHKSYYCTCTNISICFVVVKYKFTTCKFSKTK